MKAFNLRGTNGSGKTTVAREVIRASNATPDSNFQNIKSKRPLVYRGVLNDTPLYVLGSYETDCGGCDTIDSVHKVAELLTTLRDSGENGVIFYEGLMISHMIGTVGNAVKSWGADHIMGFLNTPVEVCIQRVRSRRLAKGNTKPFDPNKTLVGDYRAVQGAKRNAIEQGFRVVTIDYETAASQVMSQLAALACGVNGVGQRPV